MLATSQRSRSSTRPIASNRASGRSGSAIALKASDVVAAVEKVDAAQPQVVLSVQEDLKAKAPFRRLAVHFKGDDDAKKLDHVPQLLKRLGPDLGRRRG